MNQRALIISTSHDSLGNTGNDTGLWLEELAVPFRVFRQHQLEVRIASPAGGKPPLDPNSMREQNLPVDAHDFLDDETSMSTLERSVALDAIGTERFNMIFIAGGHGAMWDLPGHEALGRLLSRAWAEGAVIGAVCHGPAGLLAATTESGKALVAGRRVTAFTDEEERGMELQDVVPFLLESRLREQGAEFEKGNAPFESFAVRDGRLVTGQNPASSKRTATLMIEALEDTSRADMDAPPPAYAS